MMPVLTAVDMSGLVDFAPWNANLSPRATPYESDVVATACCQRSHAA